MTRSFAAALLAFAAVAWADAPPDPTTNPYLATVVGVSLELKAHVPDAIPLEVRRLPRYEGRVIPEVLRYGARLDYSYAKQKGPAPLIFVIAGTGAAHDSELTQFLMRAFYAAGFHVVGITSPTYPTFIIAASSTMVPGEQRHDAQDIYAVMQKIWAEIGANMQVTSFYLTGYSIGATNAAFVSLLDEVQRAFNFEKVLLLDPSVQIYNSISKLDRFIENIPGGVDNFDVVFRRIVSRVGAKYRNSTTVTFTPELVYAAVRDDPPTNEELIALIGVSFRLASSALIFTSDVMTNGGFIKPANEILTQNTKLDDYLDVSLRVGFTDYFHEYMWPYFARTHTTTALTREEFAQLQSLTSIGSYLAAAQKIGVVSNRDDVILERGEIKFLTDTFGARAKIYPTGGHLGNLEQREVIDYMVQYFQR
ncbi:MAG TPA: hypothetical protein VL379_10300 [Pseudomonadales bacterium]|jgi:hypothetical protein|nr:hypothetical protein [Pseudomonadales bacterium]